MNIWIAIFLFLHVMGAIVAFGPNYSFPIIGAMAGKEPQHANFASRVNEAITNQRIIPLAIFQGITGLVLIWLTGMKPRMPLTSTVRPPLFVSTTRASTTMPVATLDQSTSTAAPRRDRRSKPLALS